MSPGPDDDRVGGGSRAGGRGPAGSGRWGRRGGAAGAAAPVARSGSGRPADPAGRPRCGARAARAVAADEGDAAGDQHDGAARAAGTAAGGHGGPAAGGPGRDQARDRPEPARRAARRAHSRPRGAPRTARPPGRPLASADQRDAEVGEQERRQRGQRRRWPPPATARQRTAAHRARFMRRSLRLLVFASVRRLFNAVVKCSSTAAVEGLESTGPAAPPGRGTVVHGLGGGALRAASTTSSSRPRRSTTPSARPSWPTAAASEYHAVTLASRLMASAGRAVALDVRGVGRLEGTLERVGRRLVPARGARRRTGSCRPPRSGASHGASERSVPEVAWSPVARLGLGSALRRLADAGERCVLHLLDGGAARGRAASGSGRTSSRPRVAGGRTRAGRGAPRSPACRAGTTTG